MLSYHPRGRAEWVTPSGGVFGLGPAFYEESGGIFEPSAHYASLVT